MGTFPLNLLTLLNERNDKYDFVEIINMFLTILEALPPPFLWSDYSPKAIQYMTELRGGSRGQALPFRKPCVSM